MIQMQSAVTNKVEADRILKKWAGILRGALDAAHGKSAALTSTGHQRNMGTTNASEALAVFPRCGPELRRPSSLITWPGRDKLLCSTLRAVEVLAGRRLRRSAARRPQCPAVCAGGPRRQAHQHDTGQRRESRDADPYRGTRGRPDRAQGYENGRAFSLVIARRRGRASIAAASDERGSSCLPPARRSRPAWDGSDSHEDQIETRDRGGPDGLTAASGRPGARRPWPRPPARRRWRPP